MHASLLQTQGKSGDGHQKQREGTETKRGCGPLQDVLGVAEVTLAATGSDGTPAGRFRLVVLAVFVLTAGLISGGVFSFSSNKLRNRKDKCWRRLQNEGGHGETELTMVQRSLLGGYFLYDRNQSLHLGRWITIVFILRGLAKTVHCS